MKDKQETDRYVEEFGYAIVRDSFANVLFLAVLVFVMASIYAVNHEESAIIANQKQKGVAEDGR